jgi:hypothetical protein
MSQFVPVQGWTRVEMSMRTFNLNPDSTLTYGPFRTMTEGAI